ncbi:helix-turn-helix transcriptional regulator [Azospirillum rugosum]|uniref:Prophage regulatory protein n=2 Tax=Azospirillum rugosum TaxID=416170 RepID=A0ABS4SEL6_9PROT|nr:AlpA family transcriptional regulator [Azospirillum rugosum]MBP2291013.1 prophage regulatory protein [Azospirillum rugosum]MDQ0524923.1 prophage regulatory protein [Azospirillum rugosum]
MNTRFLRFPEVQARVGGYTRVHIDRLEKQGKFPKRVKIGANAVGWAENEIDAWMKEKMVEREAAGQSGGVAHHAMNGADGREHVGA